MPEAAPLRGSQVAKSGTTKPACAQRSWAAANLRRTAAKTTKPPACGAA
jgi:hypothetical protein